MHHVLYSREPLFSNDEESFVKDATIASQVRILHYLNVMTKQSKEQGHWEYDHAQGGSASTTLMLGYLSRSFER